MTTHKLNVLDFDDESYVLIAVHCNLEDYRLAFLLNEALGIRLKRSRNDVDFKYMKASYPMFEWENEQEGINWVLVGNICKREEDGFVSSGTLFDSPFKNIKFFQLIPELEQVNFFLKIENDDQPIQTKIILEKINSIPHIAAVYEVDAGELKSRENLIFS
ncbi:MAG: IPExxxVDY family protein [Flavobacteriaceae bacterium]|nr:IPExxxVDY family protein [Flavobacteriaceae bacterium]